MHNRQRNPEASRWRRVREIVTGAVLVVALPVAVAASAGCAASSPAVPASHVTAVVVAEHDAELAAVPSTQERDAIERLAADPDVDGAQVYVIAAGSPEVAVVDMEPRRPNGDIERGPRIDELVDERMIELDAAIADAAARGTATDPLPALDAAARTGAGRILLITAGLGLTGPLDPAAAAWDRAPADLVEEAADLIPDLTGRTVVISGLGRTAGEQEPLGVAEQRWLRELWIALCVRSGASCHLDDGVRTAGPSRSVLDGPVIEIPEPVPPYRAPGGERVVEVPAPLLFGPDSCAVPDPGAATATLRSVVELLGPGAVVHISGRTAPVGNGDGVELARCRAERAAELLRSMGVAPTAIGDVRGDGHLLDTPGSDDPQRLAALRRVVFTVVTPQDQL